LLYRLLADSGEVFEPEPGRLRQVLGRLGTGVVGTLPARPRHAGWF
jgi:hypothetical protein